MFGGAVALAEQWKKLDFTPDLILATDMLDLSTFLALTRRETAGIPVALYFHENQITYPWSPSDQDVALRRHNEYGFINYISALSADAIFFNSHYHQASFFGALPDFLKQFPDQRNLENIAKLEARSAVLPLGLDLAKLDTEQRKKENEIPVLLWNHRWEYDKHPEEFYQLLLRLRSDQVDFRLVVLGESYAKSPKVFQQIEKEFAEQLLHFGYAKDWTTYAQWLWQSDVLPVTSQQDFFGGSVVEAIYCGVYPILPQRLAYPEHLPATLKDQHYYEHPEEFYQKVKSILIKSDRESRQNFVARYDWSNLAPTYDQTFRDLKANKHAPH